MNNLLHDGFKVLMAKKKESVIGAKNFKMYPYLLGYLQTSLKEFFIKRNFKYFTANSQMTFLCYFITSRCVWE